jgi:GrpB-like predicted nucleotidyltransferase (UPF0157 family)
MVTQTKRVILSPYNHNWPDIFAAEALKIKKALGDNCVEIHHIGSTSVPSLAAKPKIDIIAAVKDLVLHNHKLDEIGYFDQGHGFNIPLRRCFTIRGETEINLHIFEENDPEIELNILFRDYLRNNPDARMEYEALKYRLIAIESSHYKGRMYKNYTLGKHEFIHKILSKAGFTGLRLVICTHESEFEAARNLGENIEDVADHEYVVLYNGVEIIAYAHVRLTPEFSIQSLMMKKKGFEQQFLELIEKWQKIR